MQKETTWSLILKTKQMLVWPLAITFILEAFQTQYMNVFALVLMLLWAVFLCRKSLIDIPGRIVKFPSLILFELWAALSLFWTVLPTITGKLVLIEMALLMLTISTAQYAVVCNKDVGGSLKAAAYFMIIVVFVYALLFFNISYKANGLTSFFANKNGLGFTIGICFLVVFFSKKSNLLDYALTFFAFGMLVLSQSKTSIILVGFVLALLALTKVIRWWFESLQAYTQGFFLLLARGVPYIFYLALVFVIFFRADVSSLLTESISDDLFTGRGLLWNALLMRSSDNLLLGFGPGVFWGAGAESEIAQTQLYVNRPWIQKLLSADGGYVDVIGSLGYIGLTLLIMSFIQVFQLLFKLRNHKDTPLFFALVVFFILHSVTETHFYKFRDLLWFLYLILYFYLSFLYSHSLQAKTNTSRVNLKQ